MRKVACLLLSGLMMAFAASAQDVPYLDESLSPAVRAKDLVSRLSLEEKISLLRATSPGIPRLGIPKYYHGNEALHGIVRPGRFTVFPQAIALGATWNPDLIHEVASAASDEGRARWNSLGYGAEQKNQFSDLLTFWSPTVNMARDPRWGRTPETYGEDPFLTGRIGIAFVTGLQGDDPKYIKVVSTPKHFVANNEEHNRAECNAIISEKNLREYYLAAFEACITEGKAQSIMTAYNAINGIPCTINKWLVTDVLRGDWGFDGYVVSDCGAPSLVVNAHKFVSDYVSSAALCMEAGLDLECGDHVYVAPLAQAVEEGKVTEAMIDSAAFHVLRARMRLGLFDDVSHNPYNALKEDVIACPEHQELSLEAARQSIVLLKNEAGTLPMDLSKLSRIAVVGNNAAQCIFGDYSGVPVIEPVSILQGITGRVASAENAPELAWVPWKGGPDAVVEPLPVGQDAAEFYNGAADDDAATGTDDTGKPTLKVFQNASEAAGWADVVIAVMGTDTSVERETRDRTYITLAEDQQQFLKELAAVNPNIVLVLVAGSSIALNWEDANLPAIVDVWYPGENGGKAVAEVLFGDYNPGGRLPLTFYRSLDDLPPFDDYDVSKGRTYQYFKGDPLYPFGYGLSYTKFKYKSLKIKNKGDKIRVSFRLRNTGSMDGDEVAQVYVRLTEESSESQISGVSVRPIKQLKGFSRVHLKARGGCRVQIDIPRSQLRFWDEAAGAFAYPSGDYAFMVGASSADIRLRKTVRLK